MKQGLKAGYLLVTAISSVLIFLSAISLLFGEFVLNFFEILSLFFLAAAMTLSLFIFLNFEDKQKKVKIFLALNSVILVLLVMVILGLEIPGITIESRGVLLLVVVQIPNAIATVINLLALRFEKR